MGTHPAPRMEFPTKPLPAGDLPASGGSLAPRYFPAVRRDENAKLTLFIQVLAIGIIALLAFGLLMPRIPVHPPSRVSAERNNLKNVVLALINYHVAWEALPAAASRNAGDEEVLSWRVAMLPYLEYQGWYQRVDWSQPANSPANFFLNDHTPESFVHPDNWDGEPGMANVFAIVSQPNSDEASPPLATVLARHQYNRFSSITDGLSNTIVVISLPNKSVPWAEPGDVTPDEAYQLLQEAGGAQVAFADGDIQRIDADVSRADWMKLCGVDNGVSGWRP